MDNQSGSPPRLSDTEYKLMEAEFFLDLMKRNRGKFNQFNFYLSAFLSAANSVYFVMKREYKRTPGWIAWQREAAKELSVDSVELLRRTRKMRNHSLKQATLQAGTLTKLKMSRPDIERLNKAGPGDFLIQGTIHNPRVVHKNTATGKLTFFPFATAKRFVRVERQYMKFRDLLAECRKYYELLAPFVAQCVEKFGRPGDTGGRAVRAQPRPDGPQPAHP
jgi:hypothetical protein